MLTLAALQAAAAAPPSAVVIGGVITSVTFSTGAVVAGVAALMKMSRQAGRFEEFKDRTLEDENRRRNDEQHHVRRHEFDGLVKHMDSRFDELGRQIAELRKTQLTNG